MIHFLLVLFSLFYLTPTHAQVALSAPAGWVEMNSIEPVALTWVKALPEKELREVPTLMVQVFGRNEKIDKLFKQHSLDDQGCFETSHSEWRQTWCLKSLEAYVLLSKNEDSDSMEKKIMLKSWIISHD